MMEPEVLTVASVAREVAQVEDLKSDPERAHSKEDELRELVLQAVASGHPDSALLAAMALATGNIHFPRWCA